MADDRQHDKWPSLRIKHEEPHTWIQWKGTDVCCDFHCACGAHVHFDGEFMYHVKCATCGQVYECDGHITLHKLDFEPERTILLREEDENG